MVLIECTLKMMCNMQIITWSNLKNITFIIFLKIITYLNRIGRYGKDIAVITIEIGDSPHSSELVDIPLMATKVNKMLKDALHTLKTGDISIIESMSERDTEIDEMRWDIFRECLEFMIEGKENIEKGAIT